MKGIIRKSILLLATIFLTCSAFATEPIKVEEAVKELIKKYENVDGFECQSFTKGDGLGLIKMMLRKEFGKSFMKGVHYIAIIEYSGAPENACNDFQKSLDVFSTLLEEFDLEKEAQLSENQHVRAFAQQTEDGSLSDFVVAMETEKEKMFMYMGGTIEVEE